MSNSMGVASLLSKVSEGDVVWVAESPDSDLIGKKLHYAKGALRDASGIPISITLSWVLSDFIIKPDYNEISFIKAMEIMENNLDAGFTKIPIYIYDPAEGYLQLGLYSKVFQPHEVESFSALASKVFYSRSGDYVG